MQVDDDQDSLTLRPGRAGRLPEYELQNNAAAGGHLRRVFTVVFSFPMFLLFSRHSAFKGRGLFTIQQIQLVRHRSSRDGCRGPLRHR